MGSIGVIQLILLAIIISPVVAAIGAVLSKRHRRAWLIVLVATGLMSLAILTFGSIAVSY